VSKIDERIFDEFQRLPVEHYPEQLEPRLDVATPCAGSAASNCLADEDSMG
jgi:hypothetical protein